MEKRRPPLMSPGRSGAAAGYVGLGDEGAAASSSSSAGAYSFNGPSGGSGGGGFSYTADPENQRKKRVAAYNSFVAENKLKSSVRTSFRWLKSKLFSDARYA
ncbi:unnamed protein product [Spirodela intermedia]|uniref:Uncharacterized protein n=1 Tax=Spirodela intermedia TaxID=51605 RepID=A0A7I8LA98_SPIIN|nr:unnamed protein product [Spirodela intermedia]